MSGLNFRIKEQTMRVNIKKSKCNKFLDQVIWTRHNFNWHFSSHLYIHLHDIQINHSLLSSNCWQYSNRTANHLIFFLTVTFPINCSLPDICYTCKCINNILTIRMVIGKPISKIYIDWNRIELTANVKEQTHLGIYCR